MSVTDINRVKTNRQLKDSLDYQKLKSAYALRQMDVVLKQKIVAEAEAELDIAMREGSKIKAALRMIEMDHGIFIDCKREASK